MKSKFSLNILLLLTLNTFAQPITSIIHEEYDSNIGEWVIIEEEYWSYDAQLNEISYNMDSESSTIERSAVYNSFNLLEKEVTTTIENNSISKFTNEFYYDYNSGLLLKQVYTDENITEDYIYKRTNRFRYNDDTGSFTEELFINAEIDMTTTSHVDENDCVTFIERTNYPMNPQEGSISYSFALRETDENCQILKNTNFKINQNQDTSQVNKTIYEYSDENKCNTIYEYDSADELDDIYITKFDNENNRVLRVNKHFPPTPSGTSISIDSIIYVYNEFNDLVLRQTFEKNSSANEFSLTFHTIYNYERNEKDLVSLKRKEFRNLHSNTTNITTYRYDYYCDGKLKSITEENLNTLEIKRSNLFYHEGVNCGEKQGEVFLFPNPVMDKLFINLPISIEDKVQVQIFQSNGMLEKVTTVNMTGFYFNLDVSDLREGIHFLKIFNNHDSFHSTFFKN